MEKRLNQKSASTWLGEGGGGYKQKDVFSYL